MKRIINFEVIELRRQLNETQAAFICMAFVAADLGGLTFCLMHADVVPPAIFRVLWALMIAFLITALQYAIRAPIRDGLEAMQEHRDKADQLHSDYGRHVDP